MRALTRAVVIGRRWQMTWDGTEAQFELIAIQQASRSRPLFNTMTLLTRDPDMIKCFSEIMQDSKVIKITMEVEEDATAHACLHVHTHHEGSLGDFCDDCGAPV